MRRREANETRRFRCLIASPELRSRLQAAPRPLRIGFGPTGPPDHLDLLPRGAYEQYGVKTMLSLVRMIEQFLIADRPEPALLMLGVDTRIAMQQGVPVSGTATPADTSWRRSAEEERGRDADDV
jgi:hypothetical protein